MLWPVDWKKKEQDYRHIRQIQKEVWIVLTDKYNRLGKIIENYKSELIMKGVWRIFNIIFIILGVLTFLQADNEQKLFNEGYISIYFDTAKSEPTSTSSENIGYILNYLKNNPNKKVDIIGYSDETGSADFNNKLSIERAEKVKEILVKAGIDPSRLNPIGKGIDNSVDKNNKYAKGLARKVNFSIK